MKRLKDSSKFKIKLLKGDTQMSDGQLELISTGIKTQLQNFWIFVGNSKQVLIWKFYLFLAGILYLEYTYCNAGLLFV